MPPFGAILLWMVCSRNGVQCDSHTYPANFVAENTTIDNLDVYQIMRAAGQVESLLGLTAHTQYDRSPMKQAVTR